MPGPTVTVRMREIASTVTDVGPPRAVDASSCALILANRLLEDTMNQTSLHPLATLLPHDSRARPPRIAIIASSWHHDLVCRSTTAIRAEFARHFMPEDCVTQFDVPGAFEMPLLAKRLARSGSYDAVIACALVVNGGIYRHEFVAAAVVDGLMRVQIDEDVPIFSAVLTPRDFHEHETHRRFFEEHLVAKGTEVARACLAALAGLDALTRRLAA